MLGDLHAHIVSLRRYAYLLCRNQADADDLVQETLSKALAAAHTLQPGRELRPWLFSILHNTHFSDQRQLSRQVRAAAFLDATLGEAHTQPEQEKHLEARDTLRMLGRLSTDQQAALMLIAVEGISYEEAAQVLGIPVGTLMSRLARGRERLRRLVAGERPNPLKVVM